LPALPAIVQVTRYYQPLHDAASTGSGNDVWRLLKADNGRDSGSMARKVKSDETASILSLWIQKGCKAGKPC